jgi:uncharacterized protein (TIGR00251 family)
MQCFRTAEDLLYLDIKALPGASKSQFMGVQEGRLRLRIAAAAEDGKANACLRLFLAAALGCPKKDIVLRSGEKSRLKTVSLPRSYQEKLEKIIAGL